MKVNNFKTLFNSSKDNKDSLPEWVWNIRTPAFERLDNKDWPTTKAEDWKYTNITRIIDKQYTMPEDKGQFDEEQLNSYLSDEEVSIIFVDGILHKIKNEQKLPDGVSIIALDSAFKNNEEDIKCILSLKKGVNDGIFADLNTAFLKSGVYIKVKENINVESTVHIIHLSGKAKKSFVTFPRNIIVIGDGANINIIESYISFDNSEYFTNTATDIELGKDAKLNHIKIQAESHASYHMSHTTITVKKGSELNTFSFDCGGDLARNNLDVIMNEPNSFVTVNGLYLTLGKQHVDNHISVDHIAENCRSVQVYKGILKDKSRGVFNGKVFVRRSAPKSDAQQTNRNLLLSETAEIDTKPQLEIDNDDVKCTHGAAIGQLSEDELFYLQSRGIKKEQARMLLCYGFAEEVLYNSKIDFAMDKIHFFLKRFFDHEK